MFTLLQIGLFVLFWCGVLGGTLFVGRRYFVRSQMRRRMFEAAPDGGVIPGAVDPADQDFLTRWLFLAGFRAPGAAFGFLSMTFLTFAVGTVIALLLLVSGVLQQSARIFSAIPGAVNDLFAATVYAAPWVLVIIFASVPTLVVRNRRQRRVREVEQDLPIFLELLATLSDAGLSFDAALVRVLEGHSADRVLSAELRTFQLEVLAGRPRVQCF